MVETLFVCAGAIIGFAIAWFIGGKTREQLAEARAKLSHTELRLHETRILLTGTKADLSEATAALSAQSAMRAAAEVLNPRMPQMGDTTRGLEAKQKALDVLVQPIREFLNVGGKLGEIEKTRESA